jgi:hypothetical protein
LTGLYRYISADSHLEIDSKHWLLRVPQKYRALAPRLVRQADGSELVRTLFVPPPRPISTAARAAINAPRSAEDMKALPAWAARNSGSRNRTRTTSTPRCFPSQQGGPKLWRRIDDNAAYKAVVRAYNSWLAEEYCAAASER